MSPAGRMKTSIPSDVWEKKKSLIARLYKDEEWPLKQVIKQIRTEDFNPSETQLRSRLKKWRVTKPSRQTRKKPAGEQADNAEEEGELSERKDVATAEPQSHASTTTTTTTTTTTAAADWYRAQNWTPQELHEQSQSAPAQQDQRPEEIIEISPPASAGSELKLTQAWPTPSSTTMSDMQPQQQHQQQHQQQQQQQPQQQSFQDKPNHPYAMMQPMTTAPEVFEIQQSGLPMPSSMMPSYDYAMSSMSLPQPAPSMSWPSATDFMQPDTNPPGMVSADGWFQPQMVHHHHHQNPGQQAQPQAYYPQSLSASSMMGFQMTPMTPDISFQSGFQDMSDLGNLRPWRRAIYSQFDAPAHPRVNQQGRQRKPISDRKRKEAEAAAVAQAAASAPQQYVPNLYSYPPQEQMMQRPIAQ